LNLSKRISGLLSCDFATHMLLPYVTIVLLVGCRSALFNPPRLTADSGPDDAAPVGTPELVLLPAPTSTASPVIVEAPPISAPASVSLTVWVNETSDGQERALNAMMEEFESEENISVELVMVSPALLPKLMETAVLSDTLPDVVFHPVALTLGWANRNILDASMADGIVDAIGRDSFDSASLELVSANGFTAAIPSDGYHQLLIYRADWSELQDLAPPDSYETMLTMAESIFDPEALITGLVVPTESNLTSTQQVFEHLAAANGCQLIDDEGRVTIQDPVCQEALDFYLNIVSRFSPIGVQTDTSAQSAYLAGRTGMIISSPGILSKIAGLDSIAKPTCPECLDDPTFLAKNTGIITVLHGAERSAPGASFGDIRYLGITRAADREAAGAFAHFWFSHGYARWLQVEPENKVPMRWGTSDQPDQFIKDWAALPLSTDQDSLTDLFGITVVEALGNGIAGSQRWGLREGQGALMAKLYEKFTLPVVLQEMLSGYFGSEETLIEMYTRIVSLIPNYEQ